MVMQLVQPVMPGTPAAVLAQLAARGVSLYAHDARLRSSGPPGAIDALLGAGLRTHRDAILAALATSAAPAGHRFYPGNYAQVVAAAHWLAERAAIGACVRLTPAPQAAGAGAALAPVGPASRLRLLAAVALTLAQWTGADEVALRVLTPAGPLPLRVAIGMAQDITFAQLCAAMLRAYRTGARMRRHGGAALHAASLACQVEVDLNRCPLAGGGAGAPAWIGFSMVVETGAHDRAAQAGSGWAVRHQRAFFDATQAGWFAAAVDACLAYTCTHAAVSLAGLAAQVGAACRPAGAAGAGAALPAAAIARAIADQAARTPDLAALAAGPYRLSYRELDQQAHALALRLLACGARPGQPLAILLPRDARVPLCFLAGLKAGLTLAPLDPDWPAARLADVLAQLAAPLLLVDQARPDLAVPQCVVAALDAHLAPAPAHPAPALPDYTAPDHPVYIVHTSGTTGTPKAALNVQRGLLNRLLFMNRYFGAAAARMVLQTTPHWFDSALWQFFWPWLNGGCCVIEDTSEAVAADGPLAQLADHAVTMVDFTPSRLRSFLDTVGAGALPDLRHVIVGGELLSAGIIAAFRTRLPGARLHNFYGPSETAIGVICADVTAHAAELPVPIGAPIDNVTVCVVDRNGAVLPAGAVGELLIGGVCVGAGYVGNPAETARLFISDPAGGAAIVYRSGDLVRYLADGSLQCLGRRDGQVKLRGLRIESQEIRQVLEACPEVVQAHVALRGQDDQARLMAYVVLAGAPGPGWEAALRAALGRRLPAHMLPHAIVALPELPLRSSGKVDEARLPDRPPAARAAPARPLHGYRRTMAALWSEVLGGGPFDETDDFFACGGHSLLAVKLIAAIRARCGVMAPLRLLLAKPVLGPFADAVFGRGGSPTCPNPVPLRKEGAAPPLFLVHPGGGDLFYARNIAAEMPPGIPVYGFGAAGLQPGETPIDNVPGLAAQYVAELRLVQPHGPYQLGGWSSGGMIAYEMAHQLGALGETVAMLILIDTPRYQLLDAATVPAHTRAEKLARLRAMTLGVADQPAWEDDGASWLAPARAIGWLLPDATLEEADRVLALRLALTRAIHSYWRAAPACPAVLVVATDGNEDDRTRGWPATPGWHSVFSPGHHISMVTPAHAPALARTIARFLIAPPTPSTFTES